ncbi:hypothetical protein CPLU01_01941 [Colletotrichum plurivorum]|uniref:F-box domain-containing protein n=1 Tax=Colletotrichum plurivorum TaxID=2175906 RepID=A0A8H6KXR1_9PEZI|nr:hypothetical protein CPLU01_01941 [Colletotrichum plurivorum]
MSGLGTPPILKLPVELLRMVVDRLELEDEFRVSRTCRAIRAVLKPRDWPHTVSSLPRYRQFEFWVGLAEPLSDYVVCAACCKMHKAGKDDTPGSPQAPNCQQHPDYRLDLSYRLRHSHVQTALKLAARMGAGTATGADRERFEGIMAPFSERHDAESRASGYYYAQPRVVDGRFLLHAEHGFRPRLMPTGETFTDRGMGRMCPHLTSVQQSNGFLGMCDQGLLDTGLAALFDQTQGAHGRCERCPTDYSIHLGKTWIVCRSWRDLGSYQSPMAEGWTVHVRTAGNNDSAGPTIPHEPGSVRRMYLEDEEREG